MGKKEQLPCTIVDVVELLSINVVRNTGTQLHCRCPFCNDRKAHLNVNVGKNVFRCNRCGKGGGVLHLYAEVQGVDLNTAYEELCRIYSSPEKIQHVRTRMRMPIVQDTQLELASSQVRDNTYSNLLSLLSLAPTHRESLRKRGLSDEDIDMLGYRTTPAVRTSRIVATLVERGCDLKGVPGFYCDQSGHWKLDIRNTGIMIPDRNIQGEIEAIQIRLDKTGKSKYNNLTSVDRYYGASCMCCPHCVGIDESTEMVYLTEGVLKSDVAYHLAAKLGKHIAMVGLTGVGNINQCRRGFQELRERNISKIILAFDMDAETNQNVMAAKMRVLEEGQSEGFDMVPLKWNTESKGIDDMLLNFLKKRNNTAESK